jgi:hypothetical protein
MNRAAVGGLAALLATAIAAVGAAAPPAEWTALRFAEAARPGVVMTASALAERPRVLMLWRADCGPCLLELGNLKALEAGARPTDLVLVALDPPAVARDKLKAMGVTPVRQWYALGDNAAVLTALGGPPPRLPLAVAIDRGRICAKRIGLLGADIVKQWARTCSS